MVRPGDKRPIWSSPLGLTSSAVLAIAALYLWVEHRVHVLAVLPLLLPLLFCIGMHFFMHGTHGGHRHDHAERNEP